MKITIDFTYFLQLQLSHADWIVVPNQIGLLCEAIDSKNEFCYVQWSSWDGETKYKNPYLWRIKAYKSSYDKYLIDKDRAARERREWNLLHENSARLIKRMRVISGISDDEIFRKLARKCSASKMQEIFNVMGAELEL